MPAAAKLMADAGMAPGSVAGTGKDGRVTKGDVLAAASAPKVAVAAPAAIPTGAPTKVLPQVAVEHGLDALAFLEAVCRKAGLRSGAWRHPEAEVLVFEAEVVDE